MKKLVVLFVTTILLLCILCSCTQQYKHYYPSPLWIENAESRVFTVKNTSDPSEKQVNECINLFNRLCDYYGITKAMPEIKITTPENLSVGIGAAAIYSKNCLYLTNTSHNATITHEMCHYLSDVGTHIGFEYYLDDTRSTGHYLTEGVTTYLSSKICPYVSEDNLSFYEFETHIARLLAVIYGEEQLRKDFFNADISNLRDDFNTALKNVYSSITVDGVKATPFDILSGTLDSFGFCLYEYDPYKSTVFIDSYDEALNFATSIEEMLLLYGKEKGKELEVRLEIESFLETCTIPANFQILFE